MEKLRVCVREALHPSITTPVIIKRLKSRNRISSEQSDGEWGQSNLIAESVIMTLGADLIEPHIESVSRHL